jgi:DNA polymerase-3 subunit gamma/tau
MALGSRAFSAEIGAASAAFLRNPGVPPARIFFIRAVRKLLLRFNPLLWEGDQDFSKLSPLVLSLEEALDDLESLPEGEDAGEARKICEDILKNSLKLEAGGIPKYIPIARIRRAAYWCRLAPLGKGKLLLIENADRMMEGARNALLKILEEPPPRVTLVLAASRPEALLPTMLSRLRPYRFIARDRAVEEDVIRRIFRASLPAGFPPGSGPINAYLDAFMPVPGETLFSLAALFIASSAYAAALELRKRGVGALPEELSLLGKHSASLAEAAGLGRPLGDCAAACTAILDRAGKFSVRSLFSDFLKNLLALISASGIMGRGGPGYGDLWKKCAAGADSAALGLNQSADLALERLFIESSQGMAALALGASGKSAAPDAAGGRRAGPL